MDEEKEEEEEGGEKEESAPPEGASLYGAVLQFVHVSTHLLELYLGGYSKNAYVAIVLGSIPFLQAATNASHVLEEAGETVSFLHGSCGIYVLIGVIAITATCTSLTFVTLTTIPIFTDPENQRWYVQDSWSMTVFAAFISGVIAYGFMSLFGITIDAMLYAFAWARDMRIPENTQVCPESLKMLLGEEAEEEDEAAEVKAIGEAGRVGNLRVNNFKTAFNTLHRTSLDSMRAMNYEKTSLLGGR